MGFFEVLALALGLSMDACAVSVCKGMAVDRLRGRQMLACGIYFGAFQALMPLAGCVLGVGFYHLIENVDHWIAFVLLAMIGVGMIRQSHSEDEAQDASFQPSRMLPLALATSVDALAVGVTFALLKVNIFAAALCIGAVTFGLSAAGVYVGSSCGGPWKRRSELAGGVILVLIGLKILVQHLFFH